MSQLPPEIPTPVQPLHYNTAIYDRRPSLVTTIGIFSIVLACLSALASLLGTMSGVGFLMMSSISTMKITIPTPTAIHTTSSTTSMIISGDLPVQADQEGLKPSNRTRLLAAFDSLTTPQRAQLDALFSQAGKTIFPAAAGKPSLQQIHANINDTGPVADPNGGPAGQFFVVGTGRIEVFDDRSTYQPSGSRQTLIVSAASTSSTSATSPATGRAAGTVVPPTTMPFMPFAGMSPSVAILSIIENLASLALAIFLFVLGIMVLRGSRTAVRRHWIYAGLKLPLILIAGIASWSLTSNMFHSMGTVSGITKGPQSVFLAAWALFGMAIAAAYPVALLIILSTRGIKSYYRGEDLAPIPPPFYPAA